MLRKKKPHIVNIMTFNLSSLYLHNLSVIVQSIFTTSADQRPFSKWTGLTGSLSVSPSLVREQNIWECVHGWLHWLGGLVVSALYFRLDGREFDSRAPHHWVVSTGLGDRSGRNTTLVCTVTSNPDQLSLLPLRPKCDDALRLRNG